MYSPAYFTADEITALTERLSLILQQGLERPALAIADFNLNSPAELAPLRCRVNDNGSIIRKAN